MAKTAAEDAFRTFAIESPHQIRTMRKRLLERKDSLSEAILGSFTLDWADYKSRIGELRGIEHALGICDELEKQENEQVRVNLRAIAQAANADPKKALLDSAGDMTDYEVFHNLVLVATYIAPEKTAGGIILADRSIAEGRFQGKMGLVLKCGPLAFRDDAVAKFGGIEVGVGDWVLYRPSDGIELFIKDHMGLANDGLASRLIEDSLIKGRVSDPSMIY